MHFISCIYQNFFGIENGLIICHFQVKIKNTKAKFKSFEVQHGKIKATAYVFNKIAFISDCNFIERKNAEKAIESIERLGAKDSWIVRTKIDLGK